MLSHSWVGIPDFRVMEERGEGFGPDASYTAQFGCMAPHSATTSQPSRQPYRVPCAISPLPCLYPVMSVGSVYPYACLLATRRILTACVIWYLRLPPHYMICYREMVPGSTMGRQ